MRTLTQRVLAVVRGLPDGETGFTSASIGSELGEKPAAVSTILQRAFWRGQVDRATLPGQRHGHAYFPRRQDAGR